MKHSRTVLILAMILVVSFAFIPKTYAAFDWATYFSKDEATTIKQMVDKYIRGQIDDNSKKWKGLIGSKQVDDTIAKQKIYTGTIAESTSVADVTLDHNGGKKYYWKKISIPEIDLSETPNVKLYVKNLNENGYYDELVSAVNGELWQEESGGLVQMAEGALWFQYADNEDGGVV